MQQKIVKPARLVFLAVLSAILLIVYLVALYDLQIIQGAEYYAESTNSVVTTNPVTATRGNILDRYGRILVSNSACNNLSIDITELFEQEDPNDIILRLCTAVKSFLRLTRNNMSASGGMNVENV